MEFSALWLYGIRGGRVFLGLRGRCLGDPRTDDQPQIAALREPLWSDIIRNVAPPRYPATPAMKKRPQHTEQDNWGEVSPGTNQ